MNIKRTAYKWGTAITLTFAFVIVRALFGYYENISQWWIFALGVIGFFLGSFFYFAIHGSNIDNVKFLRRDDSFIYFSFESRLIINLVGKFSTTHQLDEKTLQMILYENITKKDLITLIDSFKDYKKPDDKLIRIWFSDKLENLSSIK